jgi:adhesin transport system outer membrane protein
VALRVVQTYVEWYGSHLKLAALERSLETHAQLRKQISRRVAQGFSPESDLILLVGRVEQLEADRAMAAARHSSALARLSVLLGRPVGSEALIQNVARPLEFSETSGELLARAEASSPGVARLAAQARMIEAEIDERKADLSPEVYVRAERQYGNFSNANASPANRLFVGLTTRFGAGLSVLSQVDGARARYEAAMADVEGARMSTRDQVVADLVAAESFKQRVGLLASSLRTVEAISYAWNRQFVAGRKTWLDVMNSARELSQMEVQLGDVYAERLLVTWRLGIAVRGIDGSLALAGAVGGSP